MLVNMLPRRIGAAGGNLLLCTPSPNYSRGICRRSKPTTTDLHTLRQRNYHATAFDDQYKPPRPNDVFLHGDAANYINEMYLLWKRSPECVHVSWQIYFQNMETGNMTTSLALEPPPGLVSIHKNEIRTEKPLEYIKATPLQCSTVSLHLKVMLLVRAYQVRGHEKADIDPLQMRGLCDGFDVSPSIELEPQHYGFTESDLDLDIELGPEIFPRFVTKDRKSMKLREIIATCKEIYCGTYGVEYLHIPDRKKCDWIRDRVEIPNPVHFSVEEKRQILDRLIWSASLERFLATKFPNEKRYGLEGGESLTPGVKALIDASVDHGVENIVIGSQHRGRLSLLANLVRKPMEEMFLEFSAGGEPSHKMHTGDVKTHLGMSYERTCPSGKTVRISLLANPSHLEADDPVAAGKTKAIQRYTNDENKSKTMCLTLHGDAAISGQGVVYETLGLSNLPHFSTGGTVHIIVNNQIGFTTEPRSSRSTAYCSDIAKGFNAPVFHVNSDDAEAVTFVCKLAADWRAQFKTDVFIDIVCYRKYGHNEMDQPMFTQPFMYGKINKKVPVLDLYTQELVREGTFSESQIEKHKSHIWGKMNESFEASKNYQRTNTEWLTSSWPSIKSPRELALEITPTRPTAVDEHIFQKVAEKIATTPDGFLLHRSVQRALDTREKSLEEGENIDWSTAEALAFGTLCMEGYHVRVSGQDVERGTFSQRHATVYNQNYTPENAELQKWTPLDHLTVGQANLILCNSPLSEYGVLGFEYGYSIASPDTLVLWEAQFGDFANTAQVIVDQYIAPGEAKWLQRSGVVLSLPHGYDGQGPEHSSARIERFLQLCNEDWRAYPSTKKLQRAHQDSNMQIVYVTTPANLFHVLRRQMHRDFRKPLVIFFSKSLLRHASTRSRIEDFVGDSRFQHLLSDPEHGKAIESAQRIRQVILCSGQVYAALSRYRQEHGIRDVAITRIEQLHPFPWSQVKENLESYPNAEEITWCQEEPLNCGAWLYVQGRMQTLLQSTKHHMQKHMAFVGRDPSAATATGFKSVHDAQERQLLQDTFHFVKIEESESLAGIHAV